MNNIDISIFGFDINSHDNIIIQEFKNKEGQYHREGGPAVFYKDGSRSYYINGLLHREDGPAIEQIDENGKKTNSIFCWFLEGKLFFSEDEWREELLKFKLKRLKEL